MKLGLRLIPILALAITVVTFVVARNQVRAEKRGLRSDLERRAETLAETLQVTGEPVGQRGAVVQLRRSMERFGSRGRLIGGGVEDQKGAPLAASPRITSPVARQIQEVP